MDNESKSLCIQLLHAQNEDEVTKIIEKNPSIFEQGNWLPIDNRQDNFGLVEAQGRNPERALIEKITNAIDAVLIKECKERQIDPESEKAPRTIKEALELFFNIEDGDLSSLSEDKRDRLASLIYVVAENFEERQANFYIFDKGEGQKPVNFKNTFLKFGGNKAKTYFVHGRFGTGSFGVLPNAGDNKYQLIISKGFQDGIDGLWGWTLIRKNRSADMQTRHAWYEFITNRGEIYSFSAKDLAPLLKQGIKYERIDIPDFTYGTIIKLFNYDLANSSDIDRDLFRIFNRYLSIPALPFRILDAQVKGNVGPGKEVEGNLNRLKKNKEELEGKGKIQIQKVLLPKLGYVNIDIYIAKRRAGKKSYIESERLATNEEAVFFVRNGQSHGELSRQFIRDELGLEYIAKDTAIYIDCTNTPSVNFDDVFPPTRDALRENRHRIAVQETLRKELKDFEALKEINLARRSEVIAESIEKTKDFETFINDLYQLDPMLRKLLTGPLRISDLSTRGGSVPKQYEGKFFPTFLKLADHEIKNNGCKSIPINSYGRIVLETDAQNDYLHRENDKGELLFDFNGEVGSYKLYNGRLTLKALPPKDQKAGESGILKITLTRPYDKPLVQEFEVKFTTPIEPRTVEPPPPSPPNVNQLALPEPNIYTKEKWQNLGYDENDVCELSVERNQQNSHYILKEVNLNEDFSNFKEYLQMQGVMSERKTKEMKDQFLQAIYISALVVHKNFSGDHSYKRESVNMALTQLGKCLPFILFTLQKKWLKGLVKDDA